MEPNFNKLTPAQDERLTLLMVVCAEVIQVVGKIQRHGYLSPDSGYNNRVLLENELGDVHHIIDRMTAAGDILDNEIQYWKKQKADRIGPYLHHQGGK